jgi:hypothetical protein
MRTGADQGRREARYLACGRAIGPRSSACDDARESDGKMRRGGSKAARTQHQHPVDERGRVHGVPELSAKADKPVAGKISVALNAGKEKRRWGTRRANQPRLRGQDKSRKVLGGRTGSKSRNNNVHGKGASTSITLLHATTHWKDYELHTLRVDPP